MKRYQWVLKGKEWQITSNNGMSFNVADNLGMYYLSQLLTNQKHKIPYSNLITQGKSKEIDVEFEDSHNLEMLKYGLHETNWYTAIPKVDVKTVKDIAKEILVVQDQIRELVGYHDFGRSDALRDELERLQEYLAKNTKQKRVKVFRVDEIQMFYSVKKALQYVLKKLSNYDQFLVSNLTSIIHLHPGYIEMETSKELEIIITK